MFEVSRQGRGKLIPCERACIEKALRRGDERLMKTFVWSLNVFNGLCGCKVGKVGLNNIGGIIGYHMM